MSTSETTQGKEKNEGEKPENGCSDTTDQQAFLNTILNSMPKSAESDTLRKDLKKAVETMNDGGEVKSAPSMEKLVGINPIKTIATFATGKMTPDVLMEDLRNVHTKLGALIDKHEDAQSSSDNTGKGGK